jgi:hypothetical protein
MERRRVMPKFEVVMGSPHQTEKGAGKAISAAQSPKNTLSGNLIWTSHVGLRCYSLTMRGGRSPWRFPPWKRRDDTYFICAENLAVDRPKPERSVARGLGVVITYCRLRASISALLISP